MEAHRIPHVSGVVQQEPLHSLQTARGSGTSQPRAPLRPPPERTLTEPDPPESGVLELFRPAAGVGEEILVARARAGDEEAFARLYEGLVDRVYALCLRMARDRARAQELTQDVFVRVWERLTTFRGESAFPSWVYRIAVNVVIDAQRKEGRQRTELGDGDALAQVPAVTGDPLALVDVEDSLGRLPERARLMLLLYAVEGYRYDEVAELTGTALGTVKAQIHRARRLLAADLER